VPLRSGSQPTYQESAMHYDVGVERLNQRPFGKREGSRSSVFAAVQRHALRPLPSEPFDMS
jgi:hypothetical protein